MALTAAVPTITELSAHRKDKQVGMLRTGKSIGAKSRLVFSRGWGGNRVDRR